MQPARIVDVIKEKFDIALSINALVHVGANTGQEVDQYEAAGLTAFHIEAMPDAADKLRTACAKTKLQTAIEACCDAEAGQTREFHVASNSLSSSLLPFSRHAVTYQAIDMVNTLSLRTTTLDHLVQEGRLPENPSFLVLDVQGAEEQVLSGARTLLAADGLWGTRSEVSLDEMYAGGATFDTLYADHLKPAGFYLYFVRFNKAGWADAVFLKRWWRQEGERLAPLVEIANSGKEKALT